MEIKDLNPSLIWTYFDQITKIPHPSKKEEKLVQYLVDFAKEQGLEVKKDEANNVLIRKKATPGKENLATLILQSHIDMVCEKNNDVQFDFEKDAIQTYIDNGWVKAKGTTLGADDGIGVAAALAILASKDLEHGNLECLFTTDEETGLTGAYALKNDLLTGSILVNLDTEEEGEFYVGCAGGKNIIATFHYQEETTPAGYYWFNVQVKGLNGGHSGSEIDKGLGNANKILTRYLWTLMQSYPLALAEITGGNLSNAIPREASAIAGIPFASKEKIAVNLNVLLAEVQAELKAVDSEVAIIIETADVPASCIDRDTTEKLLNALYACPHGVIGMSFEIPGLVETSTNLASVKMTEGNTIVVTTSQRSSTNSLKVDVANMVTAVFKLAGAGVRETDGYPGWKPNPNSNILKISEKVYKDLFGDTPEIKAIHAGLECGLFLEKYPHLDMISCGPTILGAHSPEERIEIATVEKWWKFLVELLKNIPASA
ncbi:MAG: aminoacyl-histidine dipeptidase [Dysgonamonadaceae bacterium]|jgi:dipeptidase D|nr:aminoacyl-histidine dipeptidase [Dysgonamonadaceae bacterium]